MEQLKTPAPAARRDGLALELLVHGVGGATPEEMLGDPRTVRVTGDATAAVFRRAEDVDAEGAAEGTGLGGSGRGGSAGGTAAAGAGPGGGLGTTAAGGAGLGLSGAAGESGTEAGGGAGGAGGAGRRAVAARREPVREAYVWSNLTSGNASRALWLVLLPFMVVNLAHWMRPASRGRPRAVRAYGLLVRLLALSLTVLLTASVCEVALDLTAWQCAGTHVCAERHGWLGFLAPTVSGGGWWSLPGRRLALAALPPAALTGLLWFLSHRTWNAYESQTPLPRPAEGDDTSGDTPALGRPGFWYGRRLVARLRAAHTAAALLTVAAAVGLAAARHDRRPGGPAVLDALGHALTAAHAAGAVLVLWVVCRRGRTERRLDRELDTRLVRALPLAALALLALTLVYAGWDRPGWESSGRLHGDTAFAALMSAQGLLVIVMAVVATALHRSRPDPRAAMRGLGGPAVAMLACALGGVMTGGVAQRVADWLDGTHAVLTGPPVLLTWQSSVIPPLLVVLLVLGAVLARRTLRTGRAETAAVVRAHPEVRHDRARVRDIATARALATLTDRVPLIVSVGAAATLPLGAAALTGALVSGETPARAADGAPPLVAGLAGAAQALGSWLIGFGFVLFVALGRRAYKDPSARRTIGILWDVGTFWPRAAHPFSPPCYAERAVPDLTWRVATWTRATGGRLVISGHSQGSVLAAAAAWQLSPADRGRVALLTYGSPLERLYGRWFPAHFGPDALAALQRDVVHWRNLYRTTDPIGGPVRVTGEDGAEVDHPPLRDPLEYGRTERHPLPAPILGHSEYQADPAFALARAALLDRLRPELGAMPAQRGPEDRADGAG